MEKRRNINRKIIEWIKNRANAEYQNDISLVLVYGSYINGTANSKSDVDCYFIPKIEKGCNFAFDFIIEDVGYDIFPMSWERVEGIADLKESLMPLVGDAQIIYCGDSKEQEHFTMLQNKLKNNLLNNEYIKGAAEKRCKVASKLVSKIKASENACEVRKTAGEIIMLLAEAVALYNHDYFHFGLKRQDEDLRDKFTEVPSKIVSGYKDVIVASYLNAVIDCSVRLFHDVCDYLCLSVMIPEVEQNERTYKPGINAAWLAEFYEEGISTFNKVYVCCEHGNYILAFLSAVCLQRELDDAAEAGCPSFDLLSDFNYQKLERMAEKTHEVEKKLVKLIEENGGKIKRYDTFEQFKLAQL